MPTYLTPGVYIQEPAFAREPVDGASMVTVEFVARMLSQSTAFRALEPGSQREIAGDTARIWAALGTDYFDGRLLAGDDLDDEQVAQRPRGDC